MKQINKTNDYQNNKTDINMANGRQMVNKAMNEYWTTCLKFLNVKTNLIIGNTQSEYFILSVFLTR